MTEAQIRDTYERLAACVVSLEHDTTMGPDYFRERLLTARAYADECAQIYVDVNKALAATKIRVRQQKALVRVLEADDGQATARHSARMAAESAEEEQLALKALLEAVALRRRNLQSTQQDIRLLLTMANDEQFLTAGRRTPENVSPSPASGGKIDVGHTPIREYTPQAVVGVADTDLSAFFGGARGTQQADGSGSSRG